MAEVVGLGAIKYADLSQNRLSDYVFDWQKMMAMNGNTATYLQYAYARIQSIFRKGEIDRPQAIRKQPPAIVLNHPAERGLGVRLLRLPEVLELAAAELKPNILTDYLFDLANAFSTFFEECPVLKAESAERRDSRLAICDLTAQDLEIRARTAWNRCHRPNVKPSIDRARYPGIAHPKSSDGNRNQPPGVCLMSTQGRYSRTAVALGVLSTIIVAAAIPSLRTRLSGAEVAPSSAPAAKDEPHRSPIALALRARRLAACSSANQTAGTVSLRRYGERARCSTSWRPAKARRAWPSRATARAGSSRTGIGYDLAVLEIKDDRIDHGRPRRGRSRTARGRARPTARRPTWPWA